MAVRRLKELGERIPQLERLNHRSEEFSAWREDLRQLLQRNWSEERLPNFSEMVIRPFGGPEISRRDLEEYRRGLTLTNALIERVLKNERELAEYEENKGVLEVFIAPGDHHDAYTQIRQIVSQCKAEVVIIDNYMDGTIFPLLRNVQAGVTVKLLTFNVPGDFALEARKFVQQHGCTLEIKRDRTDFHDRFIITDDSKAFHLGHSIKDAGTKAMMINELADARNVAGVVSVFQSTWATAAALAF